MPNKSSGFTLIELLIVVAIISILSVVGYVQYNNIQKSARDAKRKADIESIGKSMEINKTSSGYQILQTSFFSGGIPYDPRATGISTPNPPNSGCGNSASADPFVKGCWYCLKKDGDPADYCRSSDYWINDTSQVGYQTRWVFCANLEAGPTSANYYCRSSSQ